MFYPVAVDGQMPFVDQNSHREQQIKRVIQKHRAKRHRDGIQADNKYSLQKTKVYRQSQNINTMPGLKSNRCDLISASTDLSKLDSDDSNVQKFSKTSILNAIKTLFTGTKSKDSENKNRTAYKPKFQQRGANPKGSSSPISIARSRKNPHDSNSNSPPGVSPKRLRTRTVSNISSVMETIIEELPEEGFIVNDDTDDSESYSSSNNFSSTSGSLNELLIDATPSTSQSSDSISHSCDSIDGVLLDS